MCRQSPILGQCGHKISHLWQLPALFQEKKQLREERARGFSHFQRTASAHVSNQARRGTCRAASRRCWACRGRPAAVLVHCSW